MKNRKKLIAKLIFIAALVLVIWITFKDSMGDILQALQETSPYVVLLICLSSVIYHLFEGAMTCSLARRYNPEFRYRQGVFCAFYCSFYRLTTLGSGTGVAAVYYLGQNGIEYSGAISLYMIQYVVHKIGIAIFSGILFVLCWPFMIGHYAGYVWLLVLAYVVTVLICIALILLIMMRRLHEWLLRLGHRFNKKGKLDHALAVLEEKVQIMGGTAREILKDWKQILKLLAITLIKCIFWYAIPFLVVGAVKLTFLHSLSVSSLAVMTAAVIPAPAGVGSLEFVMTLLYTPLLGVGQAAATTVLYRTATFVFPMVLGLVLLLTRRAIRKRLGLTDRPPALFRRSNEEIETRTDSKKRERENEVCLDQEI